MFSFFIWLAVAFIALLVEMSSSSFFLFFSFFFGGCAAALTSLYSHSFVFQSSVFLIVSVFVLLIIKSIGRLLPKKPTQDTNIYALKGKPAVVTQMISSIETGSVKVGGELWRARSTDSKDILPGEIVTVVDVQGVHLIVQKR